MVSNIHVHQESNVSSPRTTTGCHVLQVTMIKLATTHANHVLKVLSVLFAVININPVLPVDILMVLCKWGSSHPTVLMFNL